MSAPTTTHKPLNVLVVDDDRDTADSFATLIECQGHRARAVYSGDEALAAALADPPDLCLIDLTMPRMGGEELARQLQAGGHGPALVAVTGHGSEADRLRAWQAGFTLHLLKPVEPAALTHILAEYQRRIAARKTG